MKSECEVAIGKFGDSEASLKLKVPLLETELKTLTHGYQKLKEKNVELVCVYSCVSVMFSTFFPGKFLNAVSKRE